MIRQIGIVEATTASLHVVNPYLQTDKSFGLLVHFVFLSLSFFFLFILATFLD